MANTIQVVTSKDGKERETVIVLDKIQAFQKDGDRISIFVGGSIFSVSQDLDDVWRELILRSRS